MKKKSSAFILLLGMLALASCNNSYTVSSSSSSEEVSETYQIYLLYVKNAKEKGETPLSYEDWLASIKGEKGDKGDAGSQGPKGDTGAQGVGISEVVKTKTEGDIDTYEIRLTDGSAYTFTVTNDSRSKTIVDTYLEDKHLIIVYSDGSSYDTGNLFDADIQEDAYAYYPLDDGNYGIGVGRNTQLSTLTLPGTHNGKPVTHVVSNGFNGAQAKEIVLSEGITHIDYMAVGGSKLECLVLSDTVVVLDSTFLAGPLNSFRYSDQRDEGNYIGTSNNPHYCLTPKTSSATSFPAIHPDTKVLFSGSFTQMSEAVIPEGIVSFCGLFSSQGHLSFPSTLKYLYASPSSPNQAIEVTFNGSRDEWDRIEKSSYWDDSANEKLTVNCLGEGHVHAFAEAWSYDEVGHWHAATCIHKDLTKDYGTHEFGEWGIAQEATALAPGREERACFVCGYKETRLLPQIDALDYYLLSDGTYGVAVGKSKYLEHITIPEAYNEIPVTKVVDDGFKDVTTVKDITLPASIASLGTNAFYGCTNLKTIDLSHVKAFGDSAFYGCQSLEAADISAATSLGTSLFQSCLALKSLAIPSGITSLPKKLLSHCNLEKLVIPSSVVNMAYDTIEYATLGKVYYQGSFEQWCSCESYAPLTSASFYLQDENGSETLDGQKYATLPSEVTIPQSIEVLRSYVLSGVPMTKINLPEGLKRIEGGALGTGLTSVSLPNSIEYVAVNAFPSTVARTIYDNGEYLGNAENPYLVLMKINGSMTTHEKCKVVSNYSLYWASYFVKITANVKYIYIPENYSMTNGGSSYYPAYYLGTIDDLGYCSKCVPIYSETQPTDTEHVYWHGDVNNRYSGGSYANIWK